MAREKRKSKFRGKVAQDVNKQEARGSSYGHLMLPKNTNMFKPKKGKNYMDIIPYIVTDEKHPDRDKELDIALVGEPWYKRPYKVHKSIGPDNDSVVCLRSVGLKCPICDYRDKRVKEGAEKEEIKALRPTDRALYVVIPIDDKDHEEKPHIFDMATFLFQDKINEEIKEDDEFETFPDLEEGFTLAVRFSEETFNKNKYLKTARIDFEERDPYDEAILDEAPNLDKVLKVMSYDELYALFMEIDPEDAADDDLDDDGAAERPTRRRKTVTKDDDGDDAPKTRTRRRPKADDDDDAEEEKKPRTRRAAIEEDADDDGAEEQQEKPARASRRARPEPEAETKPSRRRREPDPEPEEDVDEPEEKPRSRRGAKAEKAADGDEERCPYGHKFGKDCEKFDDCDACEIWDECSEAQGV